ncbi:hypothetical protein HDU83_004724 [Entophlyctis luteolus]|nr:hypothetical protein HDU83_004724 [Entophlyctis luteolus]
MNPVHPAPPVHAHANPSPNAPSDLPDSSLESVASNGGGRFTKLVSGSYPQPPCFRTPSANSPFLCRAHQPEIGKKLSRRNDKDTLVEKNILKESSVSPTIVQKKLSFEKERQQDALNRKLEMRPSKVDLKLRNILKPGDSNDSLFRPDDQNPLDFEAKVVKLKSILKRRPSRVELEEMNIIQAPNLAPNLADTQRRLSRSMIEDSLESKLRTRPSVHELEAKNIVFCETVEVLTTFRKSEYNRKPDGDVTFKHLTPQLKVAIRNELNTYKKTEMQIHEEATQNTCFHY